MIPQRLLLVLAAGLSCVAVSHAGQRKPLDANKDGTVTYEEIANHWGNTKEERLDFFKGLDANKDGFLTKEEVGSQDIVNKTDVNKDGKIGQNEFMFGLAKKTQSETLKADKDGDAKISPEERAAAWKERREKFKEKQK